MRARSFQPAATTKATAKSSRISTTTLRPWPIMLSFPSLVQNWWPISAMALRNWGCLSAKKPSTGWPSRILTPLTTTSERAAEVSPTPPESLLRATSQPTYRTFQR